MKKIIFVIIMLITPVVIYSKELKEDWKINIDDASLIEYNDFVQTANGDFIVVGKYSSPDSTNIWKYDGRIIKYDKNMNIIWQKKWGGSEKDSLDKVLLLKNGEIIVLGQYYSNDIEGLPNAGSYDAVMIKYNQNGDVIWQKNFSSTTVDKIIDIKITNKNKIIVLVSEDENNNSVFLASYDLNGNELWKIELENYGILPYGYDEFYKFRLIDDEHIILCGSNFVRKYNLDGSLVWEHKLSENKNFNYYNYFEITNDNNIVIVGNADNQEKLSEAIIEKIDENGNRIWKNTYSKEVLNSFSHIKILSNGEIVALGNNSRMSSSSLSDISYNGVVVKYNKNGEQINEYTLEKSDYSIYEWKYVYETEDGGLVLLANFTQGESMDTKIIKLTKDNEIEYTKNYSRWDNYAQPLNYVEMDDGFIVYGYSMNSISLFKINKKGLVQWEDNDNESNRTASIILTEENKILVLRNRFISSTQHSSVIKQIYFEYKIELLKEPVNGTVTTSQQGSLGIIAPSPKKGYKINQIIVRDTNGDTIETNLLSDGRYTFDLCDDVSIEVTFTEDVENPKTGIFDLVTIIFVGLFISLFGFIIVKYYNERYEI